MELLRFTETYFEMLWGGHALHKRLGKPAPPDKTIGEAWLISDHAACESVVAEGPLKGRTLHSLLEENPAALLGTRPKPTIHGRFPLLLKLLDTEQVLSVQVHPDDEAAARLGEPDVGKTEMWHVLDAGPDAELICGFRPEIVRHDFEKHVERGDTGACLNRFPAPVGTSVFVPAGTVHAIGPGLLLAEIQQNSNITYRLHDWGRVDAQGRPRELHIEKALQVTRFTSDGAGPGHALSHRRFSAQTEVLAACRYFAAERIQVRGAFERPIHGETFHIVLGIEGSVEVCAGGGCAVLGKGEAALVPGFCEAYRAEGQGVLLDYYVPDLARDIVAPLREAGHTPADIVRLGGPQQTSDLATQAPSIPC